MTNQLYSYAREREHARRERKEFARKQKEAYAELEQKFPKYVENLNKHSIPFKKDLADKHYLLGFEAGLYGNANLPPDLSGMPLSQYLAGFDDGLEAPIQQF